MKRFVLQWHLSEVCNLKCRHCYQEKHNPIQLKYEDLLNILNQYRSMLKKIKRKGHINITGGEPLMCPYFFDLLDEFKKDRELYTFSILTNGTLLNEENVKKIASYNPEYVQVSLEGGRKVNDSIRGKSVFNRVKDSIKLLKKYNIFVSISFTATALNFKEFPKVVRFAESLKVDNVWSDRFIPIDKDYDKSMLMNKEQTIDYFKIMQKMRLKLKNKHSKTNVSMYRALQFLYTNDYPYTCEAGINLLTVMENGNLVPCRRMPIVVGNVLKENMLDLYNNNDILKNLRKKEIPSECNTCEHSSLCRGGLKCLTYAITGSYNKKDESCPE